MNKQQKLLKSYSCNPEIQEVKAAIKNNKDIKIHIKYLVILNHIHGLQNVDIASNLGLCAHTVGSYIKKYKTGGLNNLLPIPKSGAPRLLTEFQEQQLVEVITTKTPDEAGFPNRKNWNTVLIREWVKTNYNVKYCQSGMLYVLYRLNMSFTRPTYTLANADPQKQEAFMQRFDLLKKPS